MIAILVLALSLICCVGADYSFEQYNNVWRDFYVIPSQLMTASDLEAMGLTTLARAGKILDVQKLGDAVALNNDQLMVPNDASLVFLFNSTETSGYPAVEDELSTEQFIQTSLPFGLPEYHYIVDLFLMVPASLVGEQNKLYTAMPTADEWLAKAGMSRQQIPLASDMVDRDKPVVAFVFETGANAVTDAAEHAGNSILDSFDYKVAKQKISDAMLKSPEVAKAVIASSDSFFDKFARLWVNDMGYDTLLHTVFCQINAQVHEASYCLKITDDGAKVSLIDRPDNQPSALFKRKFGFWEEEDEDEDEEDDCDSGAFDKFNPYDYKYEMKLKIVQKLQMMMELLGEGLNEADLNPDNEDDGDEGGNNEMGDPSDYNDDYNDDYDDDNYTLPKPSSRFPMWPVAEQDTIFYALQHVREKVEAEEEKELAASQADHTNDTKDTTIKKTTLPNLMLKAKLHVSNAGRKMKNTNKISKRNECVEVTWRRVFMHSLFGEPVNFCASSKSSPNL